MNMAQKAKADVFFWNDQYLGDDLQGAKTLDVCDKTTGETLCYFSKVDKTKQYDFKIMLDGFNNDVVIDFFHEKAKNNNSENVPVLEIVGL
jgi:hypothetical protein